MKAALWAIDYPNGTTQPNDNKQFHDLWQLVKSENKPSLFKVHLWSAMAIGHHAFTTQSLPYVKTLICKHIIDEKEGLLEIIEKNASNPRFHT